MLRASGNDATCEGGSVKIRVALARTEQQIQALEAVKAELCASLSRYASTIQ